MSSTVVARDGALFSSVQLAPMTPHGHLRMLPSTRSVLLEVGCSDFHTMDIEELARYPNAFLVSFEPLLDKYALLLARGKTRYMQYQSFRRPHYVKYAPKGLEAHDKSIPLGQHHERGIVLPLAVTPNGGPIGFNVGKVAGCSSILPADPHSKHGGWCLDGLDRRYVESLSLQQVLNMTAPFPVQRLKIDAQGADLSLIKATDARLLRSRVHQIELEVEGSNRTLCGPPLYKGQPVCEEANEYLSSIGFERDEPCAPRVCESSVVFYNRQLSSGPAHDVARFCSKGLVADYTLACCKSPRSPLEACNSQPILKEGRACANYTDVECMMPTDPIGNETHYPDPHQFKENQPKQGQRHRNAGLGPGS